MFLARDEAPRLAPEALLGLRRSLNAPVVGTEELRTGPALAMLAVYRTPKGVPTVTLAVRSLRHGDLVFYSLGDKLDRESPLALGIDAALSFGESLGFLFDDDELRSGGDEVRLQAFARWNAHVNGTEDSPRVSNPGPNPQRAGTDDGEELLLEELLTDEAVDLEPSHLGPDSPSGPLEATSARPGEAASPSLSRFRLGDAGSSSSAPPRPRSRRAPLARLRLVKRPARMGAREAKRLLRLLSSF